MLQKLTTAVGRNVEPILVCSGYGIGRFFPGAMMDGERRRTVEIDACVISSIALEADRTSPHTWKV